MTDIEILAEEVEKIESSLVVVLGMCENLKSTFEMLTRLLKGKQAKIKQIRRNLEELAEERRR